jgi:hypothetical protein
MRSLQTSHHYHAVSDRNLRTRGQRPRNNRAKFVNFAQHIAFWGFTKSIVYIILPTYWASFHVICGGISYPVSSRLATNQLMSYSLKMRPTAQSSRAHFYIFSRNFSSQNLVSHIAKKDINHTIDGLSSLVSHLLLQYVAATKRPLRKTRVR